ncbi:MAG: YhdP family protein [Burkholderiales bacterium]
MRALLRAFAWLTVGVACTLLVLVLAVRFWLLPNIDDHRAAIARELGEALHQRVAIGRIALTWSGLQPHLIMDDVQMLDAGGGVTLGIEQVENSLPWRSLLRGRWQFDSFRIKQLEVVVRRDAAGEIFAAGYPLAGNAGTDGISAWLRKQPRIAIDEAAVVWQDELRGAAPLTISGVSGLLENDGGRHSFALRGSPPAGLAPLLEVVGEVWPDSPAPTPGGADGGARSAGQVAQWRSRLYVRADAVDSAALRQWLALPDSLIAGRAAVSAWLSIRDETIEHALVDASGENIVMRLAPDVQEMAFQNVKMRMVWDAASKTFDFAATGAQLETAGGKLVEGSLQFSQSNGEMRSAQPVATRGSLRVDRLPLAAIADLGRQLPVAPELRRQWHDLASAGVLNHLTLEWNGAWTAATMPEEYRGNAEVSELAMHAADPARRFSGISGHLSFSQAGGSFALDGSAVEIELPEMFADSLRFDRLTGQIAWRNEEKPGGQLTIAFKELAFANDHLAGEVSGRYQATAGGRGIADISGRLARADLRFAGRYTPLALGDETRDWLASALRAGKITQASLRVQGDLDNFPFADGEDGVFEAKASVAGAVVDYAEGWPAAEQVKADVLFRGSRMEIDIRDAVIAGLRMEAAQGIVPVIGNGDEVLQWQGRAAGSGAQFLRALAIGPFAGLLKSNAEKLVVDGNGKLTLQLAIPLRRHAEAQISGDYSFADNTIQVGVEFPKLENASGKLEFLNGNLSAQKVRGSIEGSPVTLDFVAPAGDPPRLTVSGRSTVAGARRLIGVEHPWLDSVHGETDWRAQFRLQEDSVKWSVESDLAGIASALPAPLHKAAAAHIPIKIDGASDRASTRNPDRFTVSYGDVIRAELALAKNANKSGNGVAGRRLSGEIVVGASPAAASSPALRDAGGISLSGQLARLDFDAWRERLDQTSGAGSVTSASAGVGVDRIALHVDEATAFDRRFTDLQLNAHAVDGSWRARLDAAEVAGDVVWEAGDRSEQQPEQAGRPSTAEWKLTARLQRLALPPAIDSDQAAPVGPADEAVSAAALRAETDPAHAIASLPAIDLQIEQLSVNQIALGRFTLLGRPQGSDWRIERLALNADDAKLEASGAWQTGDTPRAKPLTRLNIEFDIADIGAFFKRIDFPDGMKEGRASLAGALSWPGSPLDLRYANLSGNLVLHAHDGRFAKIEPGFGIGLGKLLGVLSLQNLPRRMSLDFDDVVEKGYSFDDIAANVDIQRGVANSDEFVISSPTAKTVLSGEVDLAAETQNLHVKVTPSFSDSLSIATVLMGHPVIGLTSYFLQKMLKDPIGKLTAHRYQVTGTWIEPTLSPLNETAAPE